MGFNCPSCGAEHGEYVPKTRLDQEITKTKAARTAADEHLSKVATLERERDQALRDLTTAQQSASTAEELRGQVDKLTADAAGWKRERTLVRAGLTDEEGLELAALVLDRMETPPADLAAWLRDEAPKGVRNYVGQVSAGGAGGAGQGGADGQGAGGGEQGQGAGTGEQDQGAGTGEQGQGAGANGAGANGAGGGSHASTSSGSSTATPGAGGSYTADQIAAMTPAEVEENLDAILESEGMASASKYIRGY